MAAPTFMPQLDTSAFTAINEGCPAWLATLLAPLTWVGSLTGIAVCTVILAATLIWRRQWKRVIPSVIALVLAEELGQLVKAWVQRTRPWHVVQGVHVVGHPASGYSFPSLHATLSFAFAVTVGFLWPSSRVPLLIVAALVALSRIVVGAHYPGDVLAGAVLGTACAVGVWLIWARIFGRPSAARGAAGA